MNDLIPVNLGVSKYGDDKSFTSIASSESYLPRLTLMNATSEFVKIGKIQQAHYGLVRSKEVVDDLTREVNVLVLSWRPKALDMSGEEVVACYNPTSEEFKRIATKADETNSQCVFGPEFLLYIPSVKSFAGFLMGSKTARRKAGDLRALLGKSATLKSTYIKTAKHSWFGPVITTCSVPLDPVPVEEAQFEAARFNNPPETEKELVTEERDR